MAEINDYTLDRLLGALQASTRSMVRQAYSAYRVMAGLRETDVYPRPVSEKELGGPAYAGWETEDGVALLGLRVPELPNFFRPHDILDPELVYQFWADERERWASVIGTVAANARMDGLLPNVAPLLEQAVVWIRPSFPDMRVRDLDNLAVKAVVDALRYSGLLGEDDDQHMAYVISGMPRGLGERTPGTLILLVGTEPTQPVLWPAWSDERPKLRRVNIRRPAEVALWMRENPPGRPPGRTREPDDRQF
ncbi:MAG: hypothetical protein IRY83_17795 [Chloroflexi bacterium]|nr:hypothetical protein [Chloroflexota bacterium]